VKQLHETRFIGEIGLDYVTNEPENRERQQQVFHEILKNCKKSGDKVLSIHSRRSASDVISILGNRFSGTAILHWFSGTVRELDQAIRFGFFFSINPAMAESKSGQILIRRIPQESVLTETDAPFV
jgi:TatD DNase family protein